MILTLTGDYSSRWSEDNAETETSVKVCRRMVVELPKQNISRRVEKRRRVPRKVETGVYNSESLLICSSADEEFEEELFFEEIESFGDDKEAAKSVFKTKAKIRETCKLEHNNTKKSKKSKKSTLKQPRVFGFNMALLGKDAEHAALYNLLNLKLKNELKKRGKSDVNLKVGVPMRTLATELHVNLLGIPEGIRPTFVHATAHKKRMKINAMATFLRLFPCLFATHHTMRNHSHIKCLPMILGAAKNPATAGDFKCTGFLHVSRPESSKRLEVQKGDLFAVFDETDDYYLCIKPEFGSAPVHFILPPMFIWVTLMDILADNKDTALLVLRYMDHRQYMMAAEVLAGWLKKDDVVINSPLRLSLDAQLGQLSLKFKRAYRWENGVLQLKHTIRVAPPPLRG